MGLDVVEREALAVEEGLERADLVNGHGGKFVRGEFHFSSAKALDVGESSERFSGDVLVSSFGCSPWMGADFDVVLLAVLDRFHHDEGVAVEA